MRRIIASMLVLTGFAMPLVFAAEPAPAPAKPEAKQDTPATPVATPAKPAAAANKPNETETPDAAKNAASKAASPQRFTPSEQVRADFDVSFPIDI